MNTVLPRFGDGNTQNLIDRVERALNVLEANPFANLLLMSAVTVVTTGRRTYHGLGYQARGAFVVRAAADVRVWISDVPDAVDPRNWFLLTASVNATVDLVVF